MLDEHLHVQIIRRFGVVSERYAFSTGRVREEGGWCRSSDKTVQCTEYTIEELE